jgi:hypothetical protein
MLNVKETEGCLRISLAFQIFNLSKPTKYMMHQQVSFNRCTLCPHTEFMCLVFIWDKTATCATYIVNWLVFITEMKCLQRGKDWVFK